MSLAQPTTITARCELNPKEIAYQPEPEDWIWVWTEELKATYRRVPATFTRSGETLVIECPAGTGKIMARQAGSGG